MDRNHITQEEEMTKSPPSESQHPTQVPICDPLEEMAAILARGILRVRARERAEGIRVYRGGITPDGCRGPNPTQTGRLGHQTSPLRQLTQNGLDLSSPQSLNVAGKQTRRGEDAPDPAAGKEMP